MKHLLFILLAVWSFSTFAQTYTAKFSPEYKRTGDLANDGLYMGFTQKGLYYLFTPFTSKAEVVIYNYDYKEVKRYDAEKKTAEGPLLFTKLIHTKDHTFVLYTVYKKAEDETVAYVQEMDKEDNPAGGMEKVFSAVGGIDKDFLLRANGQAAYWNSKNKGAFLSTDSTTIAFVFDAPAPKGSKAVKIVACNSSMKKIWEYTVQIPGNSDVKSVKVDNGKVVLISSANNPKNRHGKDSAYEFNAYVVSTDGSKTINCDFSEEIAPRDVNALGIEGNEIVFAITISKKWTSGIGLHAVRADINTGKAIKQTTQLLRNIDIMDAKKAEGNKDQAAVRYMSVYDTWKLNDGTYAVATGYNYDSYGGQQVLFLIDKDLNVKSIRVPGETMTYSTKSYNFGDKILWVQYDKAQKITVNTITSDGKLNTGYADIPFNLPFNFSSKIDNNRIFVRMRGTNGDYYRYGTLTIK